MHRSHSHECKLIERISHSQQSHLHSFWLFVLLVAHKGTRTHLYWISLFKQTSKFFLLKNQSTTKRKRLSKKVQKLLYRRNTCHLYSSQVNFAISLHRPFVGGLSHYTTVSLHIQKICNRIDVLNHHCVDFCHRNRTDAYSEKKHQNSIIAHNTKTSFLVFTRKPLHHTELLPLGKLRIWLRQATHRNKHHQSTYSLCIPTTDRRTKKMIRRTLSAPRQSIWKHESQKKRMIRVALNRKRHMRCLLHIRFDAMMIPPSGKHLLRYSSSDWPTTRVVDILHLRRCNESDRKILAIEFLCVSLYPILWVLLYKYFASVLMS